MISPAPHHVFLQILDLNSALQLCQLNRPLAPRQNMTAAPETICSAADLCADTKQKGLLPVEFIVYSILGLSLSPDAKLTAALNSRGSHLKVYPTQVKLKDGGSWGYFVDPVHIILNREKSVSVPRNFWHFPLPSELPEFFRHTKSIEL